MHTEQQRGPVRTTRKLGGYEVVDHAPDAQGQGSATLVLILFPTQPLLLQLLLLLLLLEPPPLLPTPSYQADGSPRLEVLPACQ